MGNSEMEPRIPYNDRFETVEISEKDQKIGGSINDLFLRELIREPRWHVGKEGLIIDNTKGKRIIDGLDKEEISDTLARLFTGFKEVENRLPDYMGGGNELVRNNMGLFRLNMQWGAEELNHGLALEIILKQTGRKTREQTIEEYQETIGRKIPLPYPTARLVVAHAAFQEMGTYLGYMALHRNTAEKAPNVARILKLIAQDEIYHWSGYTKVMGIYYERDPEETIKDVLDVARKFRMPGENLHRDRLQWLKDLKAVDLLSRNLVAEGIVHRTLEGFGFIPKDIARKTADEFFSARRGDEFNVTTA